MLLISTAECDPKVCRYFSQRGNSIHRKLPAKVDRLVLMEFLKDPCERCGKQVRVATEPWPSVEGEEA